MNDQLNRIERKLDLIFQFVKLEFLKGIEMSSELSALTEQVKANTAVETSAVTLIQGLAAQIAAAKDDPAAIAALSDQLKASADGLAAAVSANTPAAPPTPPADSPPE